MNPLIHAAADHASPEAGALLGLLTLLFMAVFVGWIWWAWAPSHRRFIEAAATLPLDDDRGPDDRRGNHP